MYSPLNPLDLLFPDHTAFQIASLKEAIKEKKVTALQCASPAILNSRSSVMEVLK